jgi:endoglucanase
MSVKASTNDTLVLNMAEDAYLGNAQFIIKVDGVQIGGVQTVTALQSKGQIQAFTVKGNFGAGPHIVAVTFLNDAFGGTAATDRNLYFDSVSLDGVLTTVNSNVGITTATTVTAAAPPAATNTLSVNVSEDAWKGNAQFVILLDGAQVGGTQTATASHAAGASQTITLTGNFGAGTHSVAIKFINDAYGGTAATDRNLYVNSVTYDGTTTALKAALYSNGSTNAVQVGDIATITAGNVLSPPAPFVVKTAAVTGPDTLVLTMAEDSYQGDAQFTVTVDGKAVGGVMTATASNAAGASQSFVLGGNFGAGLHDVGVTFINDAWGGSPSADRNLYVKAISYDGVVQAGESAALYSNGTSDFIVGTPAVPVVPPPAPVVDTLVLYVSEDAYQGDAQFSVTIDGKAVGGTQTATGSHNAGGTTPITLTGIFGAGQHTVAITFLNDANGGSYLLDRNLYVSGIDYNRVYTGVNASLYSTGSTSTTIVGNGTPVPFPTPLVVTPPGTLQLVGVNLSGLEFGGPVYPGVLNTDYVEPTHAEIDYYASKGMNVIRLPFDWERLQPVQGGAFDPTYLAMLKDLVAYAGTKGVSVDLDVHNYGSGYGNVIGSAGTPNSSFDNLWSQLATDFKSSSNVIFGLMNEPYQQTAADWLTSANGAIAAIRATGATQEILVPGTHLTGGVSWTTTDNSSVMTGVVDPDHNYAIEIHQYLDADGSGTSTSVVSPTIGVERLTAVTQWAEATGVHLFLGEFGSGSDPASLTATQNMLTYMAQHTDVWQGATEWGGGPWWGNYGFATDPTNGVTTNQVSLLQNYTPTAAVKV